MSHVNVDLAAILVGGRGYLNVVFYDRWDPYVEFMGVWHA